MLVQEILSALALAFLLGLGYLANYLNHHISVTVLHDEDEVRQLKIFREFRTY